MKVDVREKLPLFVHLFRDNIFIDLIIQQFTDLNIESKFYCYSKDGIVNSVKMINHIEIYRNLKDLGTEILKMSKDTVFVLHNRCFSYIFINKYLKNNRFIWSTWGWDLYKDSQIDLSLNLLSIQMYKKRTAMYELLNRSIKERIKDVLRYTLYYFPSKQFYSSIRYVSCVLPIEFELLKKIRPSILYFPLRYMSKDKSYSRIDQTLKKQRKILLNNSGSSTGNHVDVLYNIKDFVDESTTIYIPFSYGGTKKYYNFLKKEIKKMNLEKNVIFLTEFLERDEYMKILSECSVAIFGHIRQQAIGNVRMMLSLGANVFFYKDSISYQYFNSEGIRVFDLETEFNEKSFEKFSEVVNKEFNNYDNYLCDLKKAVCNFI